MTTISPNIKSQATKRLSGIFQIEMFYLVIYTSNLLLNILLQDYHTNLSEEK